MSHNEQTMTDATRRVTQWMIGVRGEVPLVEEFATAEDVQSFVCGHVRWSDGTLVLRSVSPCQVKPLVAGKVLANRRTVQIAGDAG